MSDHDELEILLRKFQTIVPTDKQITVWRKTYLRSQSARFSYLQIGASLVAGIALGVALSYSAFQKNQPEPNFNSTYVRLTINTP